MSVTKKIWSIIGLATGLWILSGLPILVGAITTGPSEVFVGRVPATAADTTAYYSMIEQAKQGRILFSNQFTSLTQHPTMFHPLWLVTGWIAFLLNLSPVWAYQLVRWLAVIGFLALLWRILEEIFSERRWQWISLLMITLSGGFGWLTQADFRRYVDLSTTPADLWVAESTTFQSIGHSALFIGSQTLVLFLIWQLASWLQGQTRAGWRWTGPTILLLGLIHPYDLVTVAAVAFGWTGWTYLRSGKPSRPIGQVLRAGLGWIGWVIPVIVYYRWWVLSEPAMAGWLAQNLDYTSAPYLTLLGFGLLVPLATYGAIRSLRERQTFLHACLAWAVIGLLLIYAPLSVQRRLLNGLQIPFALLAAYGFSMAWKRWKEWPLVRNVAAICLATGLVLSPLVLLGVDIRYVLPGARPPYPVRITRDTYGAFQYIRQHSTLTQATWAESWVSNSLTGLEGRTVVQGHAHQTIDFQQRLRDWLVFRTQLLNPDERTAILDRLNVKFLLWRPQDALPNGYRPSQDPRWVTRYQRGSVTLFERIK